MSGITRDSTSETLSGLHSRQGLPRSLGLIRLTTPPWLFWSCLLIITTTISATLGALVAILTPDIPFNLVNSQKRSLVAWSKGFQYRLTRPVNILIMGIDRVPNVAVNSPESFTGRSDTLLLLRLDPNTDSVSLLSIPRDTQVEVPGRGLVKVNQANPIGGAALTTQVVSNTLNQIIIDRYIRISTGAFQELVDLLDGVDVFVKQPMSYVDYSQNLKIELAPGWQTLNGKQAEEFARFRTDELGDVGRVQRQQMLIQSIRQRLLSPNVLPRLPKVMRVMQKYIDTNLSVDELFTLVNFGLQVESDDLKMVMLPGRYSQANEYSTSYWIVDLAGRDRILRDYFRRYWMGTAWDKEAQSVSTGRNPKTLKIAIQNATDSPQVSQQVVNSLAKLGYRDIYLSQDWPDRIRQTEVIVQKGDLKGAEIIRKDLGIGNISATSTGEIDSDITIRIGEDWLQSR